MCLAWCFAAILSPLSTTTARATLFRAGCAGYQHQNCYWHDVHPIFGEKSTMIFYLTMITCFTLTFKFLYKTGRIRTVGMNFTYKKINGSMKKWANKILLMGNEKTNAYTWPSSDRLTRTSVLNSSSASLSMVASPPQLPPLPSTVCCMPNTLAA